MNTIHLVLAIFGLVGIAYILIRLTSTFPACFGSRPDEYGQFVNDCDGCSLRKECLGNDV